MQALLIDPYTRRIKSVELADRRDALRLLGCDLDRLQVHPLTDTDHLLTDAAALDVEQTGFFRLGSFSPMTYGGYGVVLGNDPGGTVATEPNFTSDELLGEIEWRAVRFTGARTVPQGVAMTPEGAAFMLHVVPAFEELPEPTDEPVEEPVDGYGPTQPLHTWTVTKGEDGYRAKLVEATLNSTKVLTTLEHEDLDELRAMLPTNMMHVPNTGTDRPDIVESYLVRRLH